MRANIPINSRLKKQLKIAVREDFEEVRQDEMRRIFKLFCYVLHSKYGFKKRCMDVIAEVEKVAQERREDPIYWEHIDRYVIDQMGIPFEREKIDLDGSLRR